MCDAWSDIQALKNKQSSLREKLAQRKKQRQEVVAEITGKSSAATVIKSGVWLWARSKISSETSEHSEESDIRSLTH